MSKNPSSTAKKLLVEVNHSEEPLESRLVKKQKKGQDGVGILGEGGTPSAREKVSQELNLGNCKLKPG